MKRNNKLWIACLMNLFSLSAFCQWTTQICSNWMMQTNGTTNDLFAVHFTTSEIGTAVSTEKILRTINISELINGIYFCKVNSNENFKTVKLIKGN